MSEQYKELLKIRRQRELTKTLRANKEKELLKEAQLREEKAKEELEEFSDFKNARQSEIYSTNTGAETDRRQIEKDRSEMFLMKEKQHIKEQSVTQAKKNTAQQEQVWEEAREKRVDEARGVQKFKHLLDNHKEQARKEFERSEEKKVEEIPHARLQSQR
ncbi:hypothetical protein AB833_26105 [Chromatiales bacterium (ex Bugula neritina AB1)]|nr:hypothetical protein AB833_26105 [Chromatiales bacterium (ex Bugula neritina AB1)]